jgi:hypothetical protein
MTFGLGVQAIVRTASWTHLTEAVKLIWQSEFTLLKSIRAGIQDTADTQRNNILLPGRTGRRWRKVREASGGEATAARGGTC